MCGGDDHLAWKRPVSSEVCRGLRTAGGLSRRSYRLGFPPYTWVHLRAFRASVAAVLDPIFPLFSLQIGPLFIVLIYLCGSEQRRSAFRIRIFTLSLGIASWIRVEGRLVRVSDTPDMDQQVVTVDQFTAAMASIQEALASLRQEIGGQQGRPSTVQDETPYDSHHLHHPHPFLQCIRHHHMYYTGIRDRSTRSRPGRCR
ncbi:hypothetical protein CK203_061926 [Vitis vinifera]|uniref:Uncharacterized protein n=1 Tax=Vitis vinifera TaxID=29760 RepID=A0A438FR25_VITVI|nr:hypothetical protein CK203_061926 [Vitis vinifera]